jgi:nitrogen fixation protein NifU and related proteins
MNEIYGENILDHGLNPRNQGILIPADVDYEVANSSCGDQVRITLRFDRNERIAAVGWSGRSCAVSQATASMLGEEILGKTLAEVQQIGTQDLFTMLGASLPKSRERCVLLPFQALTIALYGHDEWNKRVSHRGDAD